MLQQVMLFHSATGIGEIISSLPSSLPSERDSRVLQGIVPLVKSPSSILKGEDREHGTSFDTVGVFEGVGNGVLHGQPYSLVRTMFVTDNVRNVTVTVTFVAF